MSDDDCPSLSSQDSKTSSDNASSSPSRQNGHLEAVTENFHRQFSIDNGGVSQPESGQNVARWDIRVSEAEGVQHMINQGNGVSEAVCFQHAVNPDNGVLEAERAHHTVNRSNGMSETDSVQHTVNRDSLASEAETTQHTANRGYGVSEADIAKHTVNRNSRVPESERTQHATNRDDKLPEIKRENVDAAVKHNIQSRLCPNKYNHNLVAEMEGKDLDVKYVQEKGLRPAMLFKNAEGLGLRILPVGMKNMAELIERFIGSEELLDVFDHEVEEIIEMKFKEWTAYFKNPEKQRKLSVIGLEFACTQLDHYIIAPRVVRELDWIDNVWPYFLKEMQDDYLPVYRTLKYPKVQKFCVMSAKGCFKDFHIIMGGAASWLSVAEGGIVMWLVRPFEAKLKLYEKWVLSRRKNEAFFGDCVDKCQRIQVDPGMTVIIPEGWIMATYTIKDTVAFQGLFLHSYGITMHLRITALELITRVPVVQRFPFFTDMMLYALDRYVHCLMGITQVKMPSTFDVKIPELPTQHQHLCVAELIGLQSIVCYINALPTHQRSRPRYMGSIVEIVENILTLLRDHCNDDQKKAITGKVIPKWKNDDDDKKESKETVSQVNVRPHVPQVKRFNMKKTPAGVKRRRRVRCRQCEACNMDDCGVCKHCLDMIKFGGTGALRQTCLGRQCKMPSLPVCAVCTVCDQDGSLHKEEGDEAPSSLMECTECYDIVHRICAVRKFGSGGGKINKVLLNSWLCPGCCKNVSPDQSQSVDDDQKPSTSEVQEEKEDET